MPVRTRSQRQEQLQLSARLREEGRTWVEIAELFQQEFGLNPRAGLRMAHGWSQSEASNQWNERWPEDPKTFKNFSYWETWPSASGYTPSLEVLGRLAELYECSVPDLISDCSDFRTRDHAQQARRTLGCLKPMVEPQGPDGNGNLRDGSDPAELGAFVDHIDSVDVHELARAASTWAQGVEPDETRRVLLLKLSGALALAATVPATAWGAVAEAGPSVTEVPEGELSGIWRSSYTFFSSKRNKPLTCEHYVVLRHREGRLVGQSLPHTTGSKLSLDLVVEKPVATGTWLEQTSPKGYYAGATYHGTLQMFVDPMGRSMTGKWLGYGKNFEINSGDWRLEWVEGSVSKRTQRKYHLKA